MLCINIIGLIYCRHKFVLAYLPVIAFYHWGKVIYRFDLEDSYEKMTDQIVKMTGKTVLLSLLKVSMCVCGGGMFFKVHP